MKPIKTSNVQRRSSSPDSQSERDADATERPRLLLAFGSSGSPWLLPTYEPLASEFDIEYLTSFALGSPVTRQVKTVRSLLRIFPSLMPEVFSHGLDTLSEDWDRILGLERYLSGRDLVNTMELTSGPSYQVARSRAAGDFRHVVTVWQNLPRRRDSHPRIRYVRRHVVASADHFIAITDRARTALLLDGVPAKKISVAGPGVRPPARVARRTANGEQLRLLFVGKKLRSKGVRELLFALRLLLDDPEVEDCGIELEFLGVRPSQRGYGRLIRDLKLTEVIKEVAFVPHDQVAEHYREADVLVVPSRITPLWQEQWGMVFMEAMSHGLPIISTDSGSISEVVEGAGLYARPNDHHSLYLRLKELALDPQLRNRLSQRGLMRVASGLNLSRASSRLAEIFRLVLNLPHG